MKIVFFSSSLKKKRLSNQSCAFLKKMLQHLEIELICFNESPADSNGRSYNSWKLQKKNRQSSRFGWRVFPSSNQDFCAGINCTSIIRELVTTNQ